MRKKQWFLSGFLFLFSLAFLYYSHYLFPPEDIAQTQETLALPTVPAAEMQIVVLANKDYYPLLKQHFGEARTSIRGTIFLFKTANFRDNEPADLLRELIAARKRGVNV